MTREERAEMYFDFMVEEGFIPKFDDDRDIVFKYEGRTYLLIVSEKDDEFFRLAYPYFWAIESEEERTKVQRVASEVTGQIKVAKVFLVKDDTWAAVEMFVSPPEAVKPVFMRALRALGAAAAAFRTRMQE